MTLLDLYRWRMSTLISGLLGECAASRNLQYECIAMYRRVLFWTYYSKCA